MFQYLLFDLDGTLTDSKEGITKSVQYALKDFGIEVDNREELNAFLGPPLQDSFMNFYGFTETQAEQAVKKYRERFAETGIFENRVYEGIVPLLKSLKQRGKTIALATSKPELFAIRILEKYELAPYFDVTVGSELDGTRSSKAEVIDEVRKRLNLPVEEKSRILMIGDRSHDILGAKAIGIASMGVRYGYGEAEELKQSGADFVVGSVKELGEFLEKN